jgi:hypothetical protein
LTCTCEAIRCGARTGLLRRYAPEAQGSCVYCACAQRAERAARCGLRVGSAVSAVPRLTTWPAWAGLLGLAMLCRLLAAPRTRGDCGAAQAGWAQIGGCGAAVRPGRSPPIPRRFCITPPRHVQLLRCYLVITPPRHVQLLEERTSDGGVRLTLGVDDGEGCEALAHVPRGGLQLGGADHQLGALDLHALPHGWHALVTVGSGGRTSFYVNGRLQGSVPRQVAPSPGPSPGPGPS